jgi:hypothetical protein
MVLSSSEVIPGNSELRETRVQREARISPRLNAYAKPRPMTSGWPTVSPSWPRLPIRSTRCSSMYQRSSTPTQARCHSEADLREAAKLSTSRRQNSDHGGPCSIRSRRRSASRRHLSRPSVSCFTDAEKNASLACASSLIERDCSTSMRKRFISMSSSFSSRRMTGNGSGASQGWGPRNGVMMTTFAAALIWRAIACRSMVYSWLRYGRTLEISKLCAQRSDGRRWHVCRVGGTPPEPASSRAAPTQWTEMILL